MWRPWAYAAVSLPVLDTGKEGQRFRGIRAFYDVVNIQHRIAN